MLRFTTRIIRLNSRNGLKVNNNYFKRHFSLEGSINNAGILSHPNTLHLPRISLAEYLLTASEPYGDLIAFECSETKRKYTFENVKIKSRNLSKALRKKFNLNKNDSVLFILPNIPEMSIAILGCLWAGITISPINPIYTPDEIAKQIKDASPKLIITCCELYDKAKKSIEKLSINLPVVCIKTKQDQLLPYDAINWEELVTSVIDIPDLEFPNPDDLALLPYSSGTTGNPKGVELSNSNLLSNYHQQLSVLGPSINYGTKQHQEIVPVVIPMFHLYGLNVSLQPFITGSHNVTVEKFTPDSFVRVLDDYNVSIIYAAPPLVLFMTNYEQIKPKHFKHMNFTLCGAAPLGLSDEKRYLEKLQNDTFIVQAYGLTETSPVLTQMSEKMKKKLGEKVQNSVGTVVPNTQLKLIKIDDKSGNPLGPQETGEILAKGPQIMQKYHNNAEATNQAFLDGWFKTGDVGYYDEYGCLYITERIKELIKVKGFQVAPAELEELLRNHPDVEEAAVIGIPDPQSGEVPRAYIQSNGNVNIDEIHEFINEKVAKYKRIEGGIEILKIIPKSTTGKILRRELKSYYEKNRKN